MSTSSTAHERLVLAIQALDVTGVRKALEEGADPNATDSVGLPLTMAVFQQAPPAHEMELRKQDKPVADLAADRILDALFEAGARGDATWTFHGETAHGVAWQIERELERFGIHLSRLPEQGDGMAAVARVRRWFDHGADPLKVTFPMGNGRDPMDTAHWLEWMAYCWENDTEASVTNPLETFVHQILVTLVEKWLPAERLLGDAEHDPLEHLEDMGAGLAAAVAEGQRRRTATRAQPKP